MSDIQGHQATMGGRVSIERLIARRTRLQAAAAQPDLTEEKRAEVQNELTGIEEALQSYKAALADL